MSADNGGITLRGKVLDRELKQGTTKTGSPWSFWIVSVLTGKSVSEVRYGVDNGVPVIPIPNEGDTVSIDVTLDVYNNRQQIEARSVVSAAGLRAASAS